MCRTMANARNVPSVSLCVLLQLAVLFVYAFDSGPLVTLNQGRYRGNFVTSPSGQHVAEYLGIPFAKPPVGKLRLANPEPVDPLPGQMFNAKRFGPSCPQVPDTVFGNFSGSVMWNPPGEMNEDCLYLNVWVPEGNSRQEKSVMVWIYGGGFFSGSSALRIYNGKTLAAFTDVIIVSISYRVGALGFLSTGDSRIPGNFGLMDQLMALTWVRDNIRVFGGNPERVTIFGESAGAVSVVYHVLSGLSNGLFQRAIIQSHASDDLVFLETDKAKNYYQKFLDKFNCPNDTDSLECLRTHHFARFLKEQWFTVNGQVRCPFRPTISPFMPRKPELMLQELDFKTKDILLGVNKNEATWFMVYRLKSVSREDQVSGQTQEDVKNAIDLFSYDLNEEQKKEVFDYYTKDIDETDRVGNRDAIDGLYGDRKFICPTKHVGAQNTEAGGNTYFYLYNHRASNDPWPEWTGVMHGAEILFVFGMPLNASNGYTQAEKRFSERVMMYWTNFAKSGNPNNQGNTPWPKYTSDEKEYLELALREKSLEGYKEAECKFWRDLVSSGTRNFGHLASLLALVSLAWLAV